METYNDLDGEVVNFFRTLRDEGDQWEVVSPPEAHEAVMEALHKAHLPTESAEVAMLPKNLVRLEGKNAGAMLRLSADGMTLNVTGAMTAYGKVERQMPWTSSQVSGERIAMLRKPCSSISKRRAP